MTDEFESLPEPVATRARTLTNIGLSPDAAVGRAAFTLSHVTESLVDEVAEKWGVTVEELRQYNTDADVDLTDALRTVVASFGGERIILAMSDGMRRYANEKVFIVADASCPSSYDESNVAVIKATGGSSGGHPSVSLSVNTTDRYESLDALADSKYRSVERLDARTLSMWYDLLVAAGVDEESLETPGEKLPASHPDSADHLQYQFRSLEPPERRGPPRR